jgi:protein-S-isoprenylcysteine O-methyltransferase Ste14
MRRFPFPPAIPVAALLVSWGLDRLVPISVPWPEWSRPFGWMLFTLPWIFGIAAVMTFKRHRTVVNPRGKVTTLVRGGPYRYSRNPMYVTLVASYLGAALAFQLPWALILFLPVVLVLQFGVIVPEEHYLLGTFPEEYLAYARRVRRWL